MKFFNNFEILKFVEIFEIFEIFEFFLKFWIERGEAEFNIVVLCSMKPHIDQVQV